MVIHSLRKGDANSPQRTRVLALLAAIVLWSAVLLARLVNVQVTDHDWYVQAARRQHTAVIKLPAERGNILARDGQTLATSVPRYTIYAHPRQVGDPRRAAAILAPALQVPFEEIRRTLSRDVSFVYLRRTASPDVESAVREAVARTKLQGIGMLADSKRYYPQRSLATHAVGLVDADNVGLTGIENYYDDVIRGQAGSLNTLKDGRRRLIGDRSWVLDHPTRGHDLTLTLDWTLQYAAETAIARAVVERQAAGGSIVAMDPHSGEILAMASYPTFNPNLRYSDPFRNNQRNQAVNWDFEPGSAFKVITAAAALHEGVVDENESIDCEGGQYRVADHTYHDWKLGFGILSFRDVLANSSNVGTIKVCQRLGPEVFSDWVTDFGFGAPTGIDLPRERRGRMPTTDTWTALTQPSMAFGQGISATPIQMATAISAIANGGLLMRPRLLRSLRDKSGNEVRTISREGGEIVVVGKPHTSRRVLSPSVAQRVASMMEYVVTDGTGKPAQIAGYRVAGKTSTAEKFDTKAWNYSKYVAGFVGFVPASNPRVVIVAVIDEPQRGRGHHGAEAAGPPFVAIAQAAIRVFRLAPDEEGAPQRWITDRNSAGIQPALPSPIP